MTGLNKLPTRVGIEKVCTDPSQPVTRAGIGPDSAWDNLQHALVDALDGGIKTPCLAHPEPFTSDLPAEREQAATSCGTCPVLTACAAYADSAAEPFHVWGGLDRAPRHRTTNHAKETTA